jgi:hypothetical protein
VQLSKWAETLLKVGMTLPAQIPCDCGRA